VKVKIEITIAVDPDEWSEMYGLPDGDHAAVRDDVKRWATSTLSHHRNGLVELVAAAR
jgi:hypothetical protein